MKEFQINIPVQNHIPSQNDREYASYAQYEKAWAAIVRGYEDRLREIYRKKTKTAN